MLSATSSDAEIVAACRRGDQEAWRSLVERMDRYILGIIRHGYRMSAQDAEDVFQEVFTKAYRAIGDLRDDDAIRPWLAGIARRTCLSRIRSRHEETLELTDDEEAVTDALDLVERAMDVDAALHRLGPECREVLDRFFRQDQPYAQIAEELGLPNGTIASRISRCLTRLRRELEGREAPLPASGRMR
jgi:RNA polymerase sigma factor (sigma-70 family)